MGPTARDQPLRLVEYETREIELTSAQESVLRQQAHGKLTITRGDAENRWRLKATQYVGAIVTPDVRVLINPKVPTANLLYLLEADGKPLKLGDTTFDYDEFSDLVPAFATFYVHQLERAIIQGLPRAYRETQECLPVIRGRIDLHRQLRSAGLPLPTGCRFDDYTANTQLNRILLGAALRMLRFPGVTVGTRQRLQRLIAQFQDVGEPEPADLRSSTVFSRLNEHCRQPERLARMILGTTSVLDAAGSVSAATFLVDMNAVFQAFVAARLKRYLTGIATVHAQYPGHLDDAEQVPIRPDLVFEHAPANTAYVADTKYKLIKNKSGHNPDYYQLLAYASALNVPEGMLIYCHNDGEPVPRYIDVKHARRRLVLMPIRLDRSLGHIEAALQAVASHVAGCIAARQPDAING
jgi:5-methylcytosine-specific restriction enzyme subunit McrC